MDAAGQRVDADAITFELALLAAEGGGASKVHKGFLLDTVDDITPA